MSTTADQYVVQGLTVSYFTRKVTGYLDHARLPWWLDPSIGLNPPARDAGWNGGIPVLLDPSGEPMWDSTAILLHLDAQHPERSILPDDPTLRFLAFLLDDFSDEWFYRHAVGTRWLHEENVVAGSWDIAREGTVELGRDIATVRQFVTDAMTGCLPRLGTTPENIGAWVDESLVPWLQTLGRHVDEHGFLLGGRPSLADFAFFGGSAAHFVNDPWCRMLVEDVAPSVIAYTHRMWRPGPDELGAWLPPGGLPDSLFDVLAQAGRHYLPWVARATIDGASTVKFDDGTTAEIATTGFLTEARGIMLARYAEARTPELDAVLDRAGILEFYADHVAEATAVPDPGPRPRPADNRPYPAGP